MGGEGSSVVALEFEEEEEVVVVHLGIERVCLAEKVFPVKVKVAFPFKHWGMSVPPED